MGRIWRRIVCVLAALACLAGWAAAEETTGERVAMRVYVAQEALGEETARQVTRLLDSAIRQGKWTLEYQGKGCGTLKELVLADRAPQLAICSPGEAMAWAEEGLLLPLDGRLGDTTRIQRQVLEPCMREGRLYMAPLLARHRRMAVNRRMMEKGQFGYLLDPLAHPVWYPTEFYQVLEEFALRDRTALEIWPAAGGEGAAVEALVQAIYGGALLSWDGRSVTADSGEMRSGLAWIADMTEGGLIGLVPDRATALERFLQGETAIFIDWTDEDAARWSRQPQEERLELTTAPYPSAMGVPVRSFELTGLCALDSGDGGQRALALQAAAFLHEDAQAQMLWGGRAIFRDDAFWLPCLEADARGATLRSLFDAAIDAVIGGGTTAQEALHTVQAAAQAAGEAAR